MTTSLHDPAARVDALVDEWGPRGLLEAAAEGVRSRRLAQVAEMRLAAQWAVLHGEPRDERDPMKEPGGEGTPEIREFAIPELAMARDEHALTTRALIADTLDLMHRLPLTWAVVERGGCETWVARKVAVTCRDLPLASVGIVDRAVAAMIGAHAPSTVLETAQAKTIEADPESHAAERERARRERDVTLSRADEFGFRHVIAKVTAGDAAWIDAMVHRVAEILAEHEDHQGLNAGERRSVAFGWLARPAELLKLLLDHADPDHASPDQAAPVPTEQPAWAPDHLADTVARLAGLSTRRLAALHGRGQVFVHLTDRALLRQAGLARVEGLGPLLVQHLSELLGHADVRLTPVVDHRLRRRVDAYEHDDPLKDHVWTDCGGDVFPFSPRTATRRQVDFDHCTPFVPPDRGGPPGQTGPHNSAPLRRRHHRWKTFGGYRCRAAGPGRHLWQTPHGLCFLVDHAGTHRLDEEAARLMLSAPDGLEIYLPEVALRWEPTGG